MGDSKAVERAAEVIDSLGLPLPNRPAEDASSLEWPSNVADLGPEELAKHMSWWSGWSAYARYHLAWSDTNATAAKEQFLYLENDRIHKSEGDYKSVTELKAAVSRMPEIREAKANFLVVDSVRKMVKSLLEGYEQKYSTISREISRRGMDWGENQSRFRT